MFHLDFLTRTPLLLPGFIYPPPAARLLQKERSDLLRFMLQFDSHCLLMLLYLWFWRRLEWRSDSDMNWICKQIKKPQKHRRKYLSSLGKNEKTLKIWIGPAVKTLINYCQFLLFSFLRSLKDEIMDFFYEITILSDCMFCLASWMSRTSPNSFSWVFPSILVMEI